MNQTANTIVIAVTAAIVAGTVTFMFTHPPKAAEAQAAPVVAVEPVGAPISEDDPEPVESVYAGEVIEPEPETPKPTHAGDVYIFKESQVDRAELLDQIAIGRPHAKRSILNLLNDPNSAQFKPVVVVMFEGAAVFCGAVNARNQFGGYSDFKAFVAVGQFATIDDGGDTFEITFGRYCTEDKHLALVDNF